MRNIKSAKNVIKTAKHILISGHMNPDGDSIGSMLALGLALKKMGKSVEMISSGPIPEVYTRLPGAKAIRMQPKRKNKIDLGITVDCSTIKILGEHQVHFKNAAQCLEIDHHQFREPFGDIAIVDYKAAAVGEIIYRLLRALKAEITRDVAENIITSIIVETNSFRLPSVTSYTFQVCAELLKNGVDFYRITQMVYWSKKKEAVLLSAHCLSRLSFMHDGRIVWSIIRDNDIKKVRGKQEDIDAVADEMRSIEGVKIAVLFREIDKNTLRVSMRSKGRLNVCSVARFFGGGGHHDNAGCFIANTNVKRKELIQKIEQICLKK